MSEYSLKFVNVIHPELQSVFDNATTQNETDSNLPSVVASRIAAGISTVFMLLGLVGNLLVIAAVARKKNLRTRGNVFIVSLSVVGILYVGSVLVPGIDTLIFHEWRSGDFMCGFHTYCMLAFSLLSLLHTMCIGLDRLVNVVLFTRAKTLASRRNIGIAVALCWLVTVGIMMCYHFFVVAGKMYYLEKALRCIAIYNPNSWKVSVVVYSFIFVLPSIVIVASYVAILSFVKKKRKLLYGNMMGARAAPPRTMITSATTGEPLCNNNNLRDKITFVPATLQETKQTSRCSPLAGSVENPETTPEVDKGQPATVSDEKSPRGCGNANFCDQNQSTLLADIYGRNGIGDAVYQSTVTVNTDDLSPCQEANYQAPQARDRVRSNDSTSKASAGAIRNGDFAFKPVHQIHQTRKSLTKTTSLTKMEKTVTAHDRSLTLELDVRTLESSPSQSDLPRRTRRGSIWPAVLGRKSLSEIAKNVGRSRDRVKPSRIRNDRDLNRMMLAVFLVVWVGYVPYPLVRYIDIPTQGIDVSSNIYMVLTVTSYAAGCVNPIIYGFMHRRFRAAFVEMLTLGKCNANNRVGARPRAVSVSGAEGSTAAPQDVMV